MNIVVGSDHGGFSLKQEIVRFLAEAGHEVNDVGCPSEASVDYPAFAERACAQILAEEADRGILICGTGIGMAMAANRHRQIRAALCHEPFSARMSRAHNDANVLCLGGRVLGPSLALDVVRVWLETGFDGGRHLRRITMMG